MQNNNDIDESSQEDQQNESEDNQLNDSNHKKTRVEVIQASEIDSNMATQLPNKVLVNNSTNQS